MKIQHWGVTISMVAAMAAVSLPARAIGSMFATEAAAIQACGADPVVWVDLDRGRFYDKTQSNYGKGGNGGYACMKAAHADYRPGH
jgi:hypothetical protein